jgi:hypothetical protein
VCTDTPRHQVSTLTSTVLAHSKRRRHHAPYTVVGSGHFEHFQRAAHPQARERIVEQRLHTVPAHPGAAWGAAVWAWERIGATCYNASITYKGPLPRVV